MKRPRQRRFPESGPLVSTNSKNALSVKKFPERAPFLLAAKVKNIHSGDFAEHYAASSDQIEKRHFSPDVSLEARPSPDDQTKERPRPLVGFQKVDPPPSTTKLKKRRCGRWFPESTTLLSAAEVGETASASTAVPRRIARPLV